jgi:hypothetical protein
MPRATSIGLLFVGVAALSVACSIAVRRDLSAVPTGQVGFDDMCGLQEYFDALAIQTSPPPRVVSALDLEGTTGGKRTRGGRERFAFENDFQLKHARRVLEENWRRLPDGVATAKSIEIEVKWSEKAGTKRVLTDEDAELTIAGESFTLPYHVCLSELLYGEPAPGDVGAAAAVFSWKSGRPRRRRAGARRGRRGGALGRGGAGSLTAGVGVSPNPA